LGLIMFVFFFISGPNSLQLCCRYNLRKCFEIQLSLAWIAKSKPKDRNCSNNLRDLAIWQSRKKVFQTLS